MTGLIVLTTAGAETGPFNLYSNVDGYTTAFAINISKADLLLGYTSDVIPDLATSVKIVSTEACTNSIIVPIIPVFQTTTTTTTIAPPCYTFVSGEYSGIIRVQIVYIDCNGILQVVEETCPSGTCTKTVCARSIIGSFPAVTNTGICIP